MLHTNRVCKRVSEWPNPYLRAVLLPHLLNQMPRTQYGQLHYHTTFMRTYLHTKQAIVKWYAQWPVRDTILQRPENYFWATNEQTGFDVTESIHLYLKPNLVLELPWSWRTIQ